MTAENKVAVPDGYKMDGQGRLIPLSLIKPIDKKRDQVVTRLIKGAQRVQKINYSFKSKAFDEIEKFIDYAASKYDTKVGSELGNLSLITFDGSLKVVRSISKSVAFDERLEIAKSLVDEYIVELGEKSGDPEVIAVLSQAFDVDSKGKVNVARILGLLHWNIKNPKWVKAMDLIKDSIHTSGSKTYLRFYERGEQGKWNAISIDMKGV